MIQTARRRLRYGVFVAAALGAVAITLAVALGPVGVASAQDDPGPTESTVPAVADGTTETDAAPEVERVTTTERKVRRVVMGLVAIGAVAALSTIAFARHTSPRRRVARRGAAAVAAPPARRDRTDGRGAGEVRGTIAAPAPVPAARQPSVARAERRRPNPRPDQRAPRPDPIELGEQPPRRG